jgi:O-antigen/teichoic acid export membrane protein
MAVDQIAKEGNSHTKRTLVKEVFFYGVTGTISKFVAVFLIPIYTRVLSTEQYGVFVMMGTIAAVATLLSDMQMTSAMGRFFFEKSELGARRTLVGTGMSVLLCTSLVLSGVIFVLAPFASQWLFQTEEYAAVMRILSLQVPLSVSYSYILYVLRLNHRSKRYLVTTIGSTITSVVLSILFVVVLKWGVMGAMWGQVLGIFVGAAIAFTGIRSLVRLGLDKTMLRQMLSYGLPQIPANVGDWLQSAFGQVILLRLVSLSELGIYSLALKVASVASLFQLAFTLAWHPYAMGVMQREDSKQRYADGLRLYLGGGFLFTLPLVVFAREIVGVFAGPEFWRAYESVGLLSLAFLVEGVVVTSSMGIAVTKKTYYYSLAYVVSLAVNAAVTIFALKAWGVIGIPAGLLAGRLSHALVVYSVSQRLFPVRHNHGALSAMSLAFALGMILSVSDLSLLARSGALIILVSLVVLTGMRQELIGAIAYLHKR